MVRCYTCTCVPVIKIYLFNVRRVTFSKKKTLFQYSIPKTNKNSQARGEFMQDRLEAEPTEVEQDEDQQQE